MNDAARSFVSVKFTPVGRTHTFLLPDLLADCRPDSPPGTAAALAPGDAVVVQTADGPALATVTRAVPALATRKPPPDAGAQVVRKATRDDVVARLKHQQREQALGSTPLVQWSCAGGMTESCTRIFCHSILCHPYAFHHQPVPHIRLRVPRHRPKVPPILKTCLVVVARQLY